MFLLKRFRGYSSLLMEVFLWSYNNVDGFSPISASRSSVFKKVFTSTHANKNSNQYEELKEKLLRYYPECNEEFTNWVKFMRDAKLEDKTGKEFLDSNHLIQFQRLKRNDLQKQAEIPETEHKEYEETLDVIKLPCAIPGEEKFPEYLFVRPDEYEICIKFNQKEGDKKFILLGNPGISKSWFQYKYILFWLRPDLFQILSGKPTESLFRPKRVVRTLAGAESAIFFKDFIDVMWIREHSPGALKLFADRECTILWEPGRSKEAVAYEGVLARMIATVSPNLERYKEFQKNGGKKFFLPCPSNLQLRLMGQTLREVDSTFTLNDKEINDRVYDYGPFIRSALIFDNYELDNFLTDRDNEVEKFFSSSNILENLFKSKVHIEESNRLRGFSHRIAIYHLDRNSEHKYRTTDLSYRFASNNIVGLFEKKLTTLKLETLLRLYFLREENYIYKDLLPLIMEDVFFKCMQDDQASFFKYRALKNNTIAKWDLIELQFSNVKREAPIYNEMIPGVLYYPETPNFPLVDMYFIEKEEKTITAFQITTADRHSKTLSTYENFFNKIGADVTENKLKLVYCILPEKRKNYQKNEYKPSFFWENYKIDQELIDSTWKDNICFYALIFPDRKEEIFRRDESENVTSKFEWYIE